MGYVENPFKKNVNYTEDTGSASYATISDDFNAPLDPVRWSKTVIGNGSLDSNVSGYLEFNPPTNVSGYHFLLANTSIDLTADNTTKTVSIDIATHLTGSYVESYFMLLDDSGGYSYIYEENGNMLCRIFRADGSQAVTQFYGSVANTAWRYRYEPTEGSGGTLYLELLESGVWTPKISSTGANCGWSFVSVDIKLQAGRYGTGGATGKWEIDNLIYLPEITPDPPEIFPLNTFIKNAGGDGYNSGIVGKEFILSRKIDQSVRFNVTGSGDRRIGWTTLDKLAFDIPLAFEFGLRADGSLWVYEDNYALQYNTNVGWQVGNELRIQIIRESGVTKVKYWKRQKRKKPEKLIYTSTKTSDFIDAQFPLLPKTLFYTQGSQVQNFLLEYSPDNTNVVTESYGEATFKKNTANKPLAVGVFKLAGGSGGSAAEIMQFIYKGVNLTQATAGLAYFRASGQPIKELRIWSNLPNTFGDSVYNVYKNGVALYSGGDRPKILQGQNLVELTGLNIPTTLGDIITLNLEEIPLGVIATPITFEAKY